MATCLNCRSEVHDEANVCPFCQSVFTNTKKYKEDQKAEESANGCAWIFVLSFIAIGLLIYWLTGGFEPDDVYY